MAPSNLFFPCNFYKFDLPPNREQVDFDFLICLLLCSFFIDAMLH